MKKPKLTAVEVAELLLEMYSYSGLIMNREGLNIAKSSLKFLLLEAQCLHYKIYNKILFSDVIIKEKWGITMSEIELNYEEIITNFTYVSDYSKTKTKVRNTLLRVFTEYYEPPTTIHDILNSNTSYKNTKVGEAIKIKHHGIKTNRD